MRLKRALEKDDRELGILSQNAVAVCLGTKETKRGSQRFSRKQASHDGNENSYRQVMGHR